MNSLKKIKIAINKHRWSYAEKELIKLLRDSPSNLVLLDMIQDLYFQKRDDRKVWEFAKKAYILKPNDPMVIWNYATSLSNISNERNAIKLYKKILKKSHETLAKNDDIGTLIRAKGFKSDVCVRIGECYADIGGYKNAITYFKKYLKQKKRNFPSIYSMKIVKQYIKTCLHDLAL